jgi:hypothetical protein
MQSNDHFRLIQIISLTAHSVFYLAILIVAIVGWRRTKHLGHMVLAMWAGLSIFWGVASQFLQPIYARIAATGHPPAAWFMFANLFSGLGLTVMLLIGLALLVFKPAPPR